MKKKTTAAVCLAMALCLVLTGCGLFGGRKNSLSFGQSSLSGRVSQISIDAENSALTLELGYITEPVGAEKPNPLETPEPSATDSSDPSVEPEVPDVEPEEPPIVDESDELAPPEESAEPVDDGPRGVSTDTVPIFTLGAGTAILTIKDETALYTEDGANISVSEIEIGDILEIYYDAGDIAAVVLREVRELIETAGVRYIAATDVAADAEFSDETLSSVLDDETTVLIREGAEAGFDAVTINRNSSAAAGGKPAALYGVGAALLVTDGTAFLRDSSVSTDALGACAIFAYSDGAVYAADTGINTAAEASTGLAAVDGGRVFAWDLTVQTDGVRAPAIRTDGGKIIVDGGLYTSNGADAPAVYSAGETAVNGATLAANGAQAARVEGKNTLYIFDSTLTSAMPDGEDGSAYSVLLYQGDTPDSKIGRSTFAMVGGALNSSNGGIFYTTNTQSRITLSGVEITAADDCEYLLRCTGNALWGKVGENGAQCIFTGDNQILTGDVIWDSISTLDMCLLNGSTLTGAILNADTEDTAGEGYMSLCLAEDSTWVVTADSTLTELHAAGDIVDAEGRNVTIRNTDGETLRRGTSELTVTVETYTDTASMTGADTVPVRADFEAKRPTGL